LDDASSKVAVLDTSGDQIGLWNAAGWTSPQAVELRSDNMNQWVDGDVGKAYRLYAADGSWTDCKITGWILAGNVVTANLGPSSEPDGLATPAALRNAYAGSWKELVTSISGLSHLEGESVYGLFQGYPVGPVTVVGGVADISPWVNLYTPGFTGADGIAVGLPYKPRAKMIPPDWILEQNGVVDHVKAVSSATLILDEARGVKVGLEEGSLETVKTGASAADLTAPMSGLVPAHWRGRWDRGLSLILAVDDPVPATIFGVVLDVDVGGR